MIVNSQMWECFIREREEMTSKGSIQKCVFENEEKNGWNINSISVICSVCQSKLKENVQIYKGEILCVNCCPSKRSKCFFLFYSFYYLF